MFAADEKRHLAGNSFNEYLINANLVGSDIYGVEISEPHRLVKPVKGLYNSEFSHNQFWVAETIYHEICYKLVLNEVQAIPSGSPAKVR